MILASAQKAQGESLSLNTFYPAPFGTYDRLRLVPRATDPDCVPGTLFVKDPGILRYCSDAGWVDFSLGTGGTWTKTGDYVHLTDPDPAVRVGIGTTTPEFKLTLEQDGGILARGTHGGGATIPSLTAGEYLIWYPRKTAFRVGSVTGAQWNEFNIGYYSTVTGGLNNTADGSNSVVGGGQDNQATGYAVIGGGQNNTMPGGGTAYSIIGGGRDNTITDWTSVIGGGMSNQVGARGSVIAGGAGNTAARNTAQDLSVVAGGDHNTVTSQFSTIAGGQRNTADMGNTVGGGARNAASGSYATIAGGGGLGSLNSNDPDSNIASGGLATIAGGAAGTGSGNLSTIAGGYLNKATNEGATVAGGYNNTASGQYSIVAGGIHNIASGDFAVVPGGGPNSGFWANTNIAGGDHSWAGGSGMYLGANADNTFIWGHHSGIAPPTINTADAFIIASGKVGIGVIDPQAELHVGGIGGGTIKATLTTPVAGSPLYFDTGSHAIGYDVAELFETNESVKPGDVLVMDETMEKKYALSRSPYNPKVIGVVSGAPAIVFEGSELKIAPAPGEFTGGVKPPVALAGRVLCNVSTENGPIKPGDLLTTSSVPGHAMKATDRGKSFGAIIGKAMESFSGGSEGETTGKILIFL